MTGQEQELPVVRKLMRTTRGPIGPGFGPSWPVNPDGPEAAELITELVEALLEARNRLAMVGEQHRLIERIDAVLTKARASTGGEDA